MRQHIPFLRRSPNPDVSEPETTILGVEPAAQAFRREESEAREQVSETVEGRSARMKSDGVNVASQMEKADILDAAAALKRVSEEENLENLDGITEELPKKKRRIHISTGVKHALLILLCVFSVFPIYWMIISSFKGTAEIFNSSLLPQSWSFDNYSYALQAIDIGNMTINTFIMAISQTVLQLSTAILAVYALTRWNFPGSKLIYILFSLTWLVPFQATMIPNYTTIVDMGLRDTLLGVIVPNMASAFAILSLYPAFKSFPRALIEAGMMDKMSAPGVLFKLILPNMKSTIVSLGILLFITSWNDYFWPSLVISQGQQTLQLGLRSFMSVEVTSWGPLMAASVLASLPILILYLIIQKQVIQSFVKWGIK